MLTKQTTEWIEAVLTNDHASTDKDLLVLFMTEGRMSEKEARKWVVKRNHYLGRAI